MTSIDIHGSSLGRDASSSAGRSVRLMVGTPLSYGVWLVAALAAGCSSKGGEDGGGTGGGALQSRSAPGTRHPKCSDANDTGRISPRKPPL